MNASIRSSLFVALTLATFTACNGVSTEATPEGSHWGMPGSASGKMKVVISAESPDAGFEKPAAAPSLSSAIIAFDRLDLRTTEGEFASYPLDPSPVDLLALNPGLGLILSRIKIPFGAYDMIRLRATGPGVLTLSNGETQGFDIPSGEQSGLKIFFDAPLVVENDNLLLAIIRVDTAKSFVFTGTDIVHFKPVLRIAIVAVPPVVIAPEPSATPSPDESGTPNPDATSTPNPDESGTPNPDPSSTPNPDESGTPNPEPSSTGTPDSETIELPGGDDVAPPVDPNDEVDSNFNPWIIGT